MYGEYDTIHSSEEYKGYSIFISESDCKYYAHVYHNKELSFTASSANPKNLIEWVRDEIDGVVEDEVLDVIYGKEKL